MKKILIIIILFFTTSSNVYSLDEFNKTYYPPDPLTEYKYKEDGNWTTWNKILLGTAIGGSIGDVASTMNKLNEGCVEANPIYGEDPSLAFMIAMKLALYGLAYYIIETNEETTIQEKQKSRNWAYGSISVIGIGATVWNQSTNCK